MTDLPAPRAWRALLVVSLCGLCALPTAASAAPPSSPTSRPTSHPTGPHRADGTLPHPLISLCRAGDADCEAVPVRTAAGGKATRYQPRFVGHITTISPELQTEMEGVTWRRGCPVGPAQLRVVTVRHWRPDGSWTVGRLIVAATVAKPVLKAFRAYFRARFPITSLIPIHRFGGSDDRSMAVDNTSAFNCRKMTGGSRWSEHAYGTAIDINPFRNPYVRGKLVLPPSAKPWADRRWVRPGMLIAGGPGVQVWRELGWGWGGAWRRLQDFQHVSLRDR